LASTLACTEIMRLHCQGYTVHLNFDVGSSEIPPLSFPIHHGSNEVGLSSEDWQLQRTAKLNRVQNVKKCIENNFYVDKLQNLSQVF
jgi:hypothetical protein